MTLESTYPVASDAEFNPPVLCNGDSPCLRGLKRHAVQPHLVGTCPHNDSTPWTVDDLDADGFLSPVAPAWEKFHANGVAVLNGIACDFSLAGRALGLDVVFSFDRYSYAARNIDRIHPSLRGWIRQGHSDTDPNIEFFNNDRQMHLARAAAISYNPTNAVNKMLDVADGQQFRDASLNDLRPDIHIVPERTIAQRQAEQAMLEKSFPRPNAISELSASHHAGSTAQQYIDFLRRSANVTRGRLGLALWTPEQFNCISARITYMADGERQNIIRPWMRQEMSPWPLREYDIKLKQAVLAEYILECESAQELRTQMLNEARQASDKFARHIADPEDRQRRINEIEKYRRDQINYEMARQQYRRDREEYRTCISNDKQYGRTHREPEPPIETQPSDFALWEHQIRRDGRGKKGGIEDLVPRPTTHLSAGSYDTKMRVKTQGLYRGRTGECFNTEATLNNSDLRRDHRSLSGFFDSGFESSDIQPEESEDADSDSGYEKANLNQEYTPDNGFRYEGSYLRNTTEGDPNEKITRKVSQFKQKANRGDYWSSLDAVSSQLPVDSGLINLQNQEFSLDAISLEMDFDESERTVNEYAQKAGRFMSNRDDKMRQRFERDSKIVPIEEFLIVWKKQFAGTPIGTRDGIFVLVHHARQAADLYELDVAKFGGNPNDPLDPINYRPNNKTAYSEFAGGVEYQYAGTPIHAAFHDLVQWASTKAMKRAIANTPDDPLSRNPATPALRAGGKATARVESAFYRSFHRAEIFKVTGDLVIKGRLFVEGYLRPEDVRLASLQGLSEGLSEGASPSH